MAAPSDFDDLDIVIRHKKGRYFVTIPQLNLYAVAATLPEALQSLDAKKQAMVSDLQEADLLDDYSIGPTRPAARSIYAGSIFAFSAKVVVVLVAVLWGANYLTQSTMEKLHTAATFIADRYAKEAVSGKQFWAKAEQKITALAEEPDIPDARKKKILADLHTLVARWRPYAKEVQSLFASPEEEKSK